ncbi:hypothetical protein KPB05_37315 [Burkholderia gladioli]|uniref:hypothetical protein n=1 Tax=Burkholderia gladioli TaxID=28095 RepID=UPI0028579780|nr:hypothetical protein [Burkholderia gladioli]MDR8093119.1 hypothetical protein [Burkholderia gladioli]
MIEHEGDVWRVVAEGATRDGKTYFHLASTTRGRQQRNGWMPLQIGDWLDRAALTAAPAAGEK